MRVHHCFDNLRNLREADLLVDKSTDCFFVRRVHRRRQRAAFAQRSIRERDAGNDPDPAAQSADLKSQSDPAAATGTSGARDT